MDNEIRAKTDAAMAQSLSLTLLLVVTAVVDGSYAKKVVHDGSKDIFVFSISVLSPQSSAQRQVILTVQGD
ncbi:hypothetical protein V6N11_070360 [Hibiscus sabdariffa]|uniref:Uncharacterized protein n=1 Tax=Hibiscus sabdariffa TaxID=183260 RepID=A0ABR2QF63_9ROSI